MATDGNLTGNGVRRPFLEPKDWRQTAVGSIPAIIGILVFLGYVWSDHTQLAANTAAIGALQQRLDTQISVLGSRVEDLRNNITVIQTRDLAGDQTISRLGTQVDHLQGAVTDLTLVVKGLTDLQDQKSNKAR